MRLDFSMVDNQKRRDSIVNGLVYSVYLYAVIS
jgi:hypothetical protein